MIPLPFLEYNLSHPHPHANWFLLATVVIFLATSPVLVLVNFTTLGFELVPALRPDWRNSNAPLETWWGTRRLPPLLRPRTPRCEPKELGRGDSFRLTGSLFDYTVMSAWNQSHANITGVQEQERVEYKGESFADCYVTTVRYEYSMSERTHSVNVGVRCPGYKEYPIQITMQTTVVFSWELTKDFIGQYYGGGLDLMNIAGSTDYRKTVLAVLDVIASDALGILSKQNPRISVPPLSMRVFFIDLDPETALLPDRTTTSSLTYVNGSQPDQFPSEAFIYTMTIFNLMYVVIDAVNLDLGNTRSPNLFRNMSRLPEVVDANRAAPPINNETEWAKGRTQSFYYGRIPDQYQTWAETLLKGPPANISLTNVMGPDRSVMATTYLCPTYELKPTNALLASVFVGSSTMILSVWGGWMFFTAVLARKLMAPQVICYCDDCKARRLREAMRTEDLRRRGVNRGNAGRHIFSNLMARMRANRRANNTVYPADSDPEDQGHDTVPRLGRPMLEHTADSKNISYISSPPTGEK